MRLLGRACGARATGLVGHRNQLTRELEARERLAAYDSAAEAIASTTRIVLGSTAVDGCILKCTFIFVWYVRVFMRGLSPRRGCACHVVNNVAP